MGSKKYDEALQLRVRRIREGLGPQPFSVLSVMNPELKLNAAKYRRILCSVVYPGDRGCVETLEVAKEKFKNLPK